MLIHYYLSTSDVNKKMSMEDFKQHSFSNKSLSQEMVLQWYLGSIMLSVVNTMVLYIQHNSE